MLHRLIVRLGRDHLKNPEGSLKIISRHKVTSGGDRRAAVLMARLVEGAGRSATLDLVLEQLWQALGVGRYPMIRMRAWRSLCLRQLANLGLVRRRLPDLGGVGAQREPEPNQIRLCASLSERSTMRVTE